MSKDLSKAEIPTTKEVLLVGRMSGEDRRRQLIQVAIRLFSQKGFRGTTTKEIAQAARINEAMIFRHFATKEDLYSAILDYKACTEGPVDPREFVAEAVQRKDDRAVCEGLAYAALQHHERDTDFHRLLLYSALEGHQLADMFWERNIGEFYDFLGKYIRERQRDGAFRDVEPRIVVRAFIGMIIHHSLNNSLWDKQRRLLDVTNKCAAREFTNILMSGIAAAPSRYENGKRRSTSKRPAKKKKR
jgi:AcrR family transcriptional regulator